LVVQLVLIGLFFWPRSAAGRESAPLLPDLDAEQVVRLVIREGEDEIELAQEEGSWVLASAEGYPCNEGAVPGLLEKLVALQSDRLVAETRSSHKRLKVDAGDYAYRVEIESADGPDHTLYVGTAPSYGAIHVRVEDQDEVYLVSGLTSTDVGTRMATWIDTLYHTAERDQMIGLTVENANGLLEFLKDESGTWSMLGPAEDEVIAETNITTLVNRMASLRMLKPLGKAVQPEYGMQDPSAVVVVRLRGEDGSVRRQTIHVGAVGKDDSYIVKASTSPYYVQVAGYTATDFVEKTRADFIEAPAEPSG